MCQPKLAAEKSCNLTTFPTMQLMISTHGRVQQQACIIYSAGVCNGSGGWTSVMRITFLFQIYVTLRGGSYVLNKVELWASDDPADTAQNFYSTTPDSTWIMGSRNLTLDEVKLMHQIFFADQCCKKAIISMCLLGQEHQAHCRTLTAFSTCLTIDCCGTVTLLSCSLLGRKIAFQLYSALRWPGDGEKRHVCMIAKF